jgi:hypothetical protein
MDQFKVVIRGEAHEVHSMFSAWRNEERSWNGRCFYLVEKTIYNWTNNNFIHINAKM